MADTYTALLRLIKQEDQRNINQWGGIFNSAVINLLEEAIAGRRQIDVTFGNVSLTSLNGLSDQSRPMFLEIVGNPGAPVSITLPSLTKMYGIGNNTSPAQSVQLKTATSAPLTLTADESPTIVCVDSVNNLVYALGRSNSLAPTSGWVDVGAFEDGVASQLASGRYIVEGDLVTIEIGAYARAWSAVTTHRIRLGGSAAALPAAIVPAGPDPYMAWFINEVTPSSTFPAGHMGVLTAGDVIAFITHDVPLNSGSVRASNAFTFTYSLRTN